MAGTTFDPSNKTANVTLSNGNRTAACVSTSTNECVRTVMGASSGKYYFEINFDVNANGTGFGIAMVSPTFPFDSSIWITADGRGEGFFSYLNGWGGASSGGVTTTFATGTHRISVAVDITNRLLWMRVDGGSWQGSTSGGDPATGTGGFTFTALTGGTPYYPAINVGSGDQATGCFATTDWSFSAPSGFLAFETADESINNHNDDGAQPAWDAATWAAVDAAVQDSTWRQIPPADLAVSEVTPFKIDFSHDTLGWTEAILAADAPVQDLSGWVQPIQPDAGTVYNDSISETLATTDDVSAVLTAVGAASESAATSDSVSGSLVTTTMAASESAATSDSNAATMVTTTMAVGESAAASDTVSGGLVQSDSLSESIATSDTVSTTLTTTASMPESAATSDSVTGSLVTVAMASSESAATSDAVTGRLVTVTMAVAESAAASDTQGGGSLYSGSVSESVSTADSVTASLSAGGSIAESVATADTVAASLSATGAVAESAGVSDTSSASLATAAMPVAESAAIADDPAALGNNVYNESVSETVAISDTVEAAEPAVIIDTHDGDNPWSRQWKKAAEREKAKARKKRRKDEEEAPAPAPVAKAPRRPVERAPLVEALTAPDLAIEALVADLEAKANALAEIDISAALALAAEMDDEEALVALVMHLED